MHSQEAPLEHSLYLSSSNASNSHYRVSFTASTNIFRTRQSIIKIFKSLKLKISDSFLGGLPLHPMNGNESDLIYFMILLCKL